MDVLENTDPQTVETALLLASLKSYKIPSSRIDEIYGSHRVTRNAKVLADEIYRLSPDITIFDLANEFELLVDGDKKRMHGVVFTPKDIADYITESAIDNKWTNRARVLDPACGCGIFLLSAIERIRRVSKLEVKDIIENNIYGIDINPENVERTKVLLSYYAMINGVNNASNMTYNVLLADSVLGELDEKFVGDEGFDYIVGNPPYVNTHDLSRASVTKLKERYQTTQSGVFNIFYAFIEKGYSLLSRNGRLSFIIPNNFIYIDAAQPLRDFFMENASLSSIIDFGDNLPFNPTKTYCAIIALDKTGHAAFQYARLGIGEGVKEALFFDVQMKSLDSKHWRLLSSEDSRNIDKIESFDEKVGEYIHTGIATLSDKLYTLKIVDSAEDFYIKEFNGSKYKIEKNIVRPIVKVGGRSKGETLAESDLGVIFPYRSVISGGVSVMTGDFMKVNFPYALKYFEAIKLELAKRDKGKKTYPIWYMYGRSQGLSFQGRKIFFPTFNKFPKFELNNDRDILFCNGYAVFVDESLFKERADLFVRILNSKVMQYYMDLTSYSIEGGYKCYQKKYIKNFSIPHFTELEMIKIDTMDVDTLDQYLVEKYRLSETPKLQEILNFKTR